MKIVVCDLCKKQINEKEETQHYLTFSNKNGEYLKLELCMVCAARIEKYVRGLDK